MRQRERGKLERLIQCNPGSQVKTFLKVHSQRRGSENAGRSQSEATCKTKYVDACAKQAWTTWVC